MERAPRGLVVVRLKGGDPFIFGRGGEELEAVAEAGIPFEVVPGVSAFTAPTYAGIPLTHRDFTTNAVFLTGTENPAKPDTATPWEAVAKMGTIVVLMGLKVLPKIRDKLTGAGRSADTPAVMVQWGSWPSQRSIATSLGTMVEDAKAAGLQAPVLTIIGEVTRFRERFNWFESRPFSLGSGCWSPGPNPSALAPVPRWRPRWEAQGAGVTHCPVFRIAEPESWEAFDQVAQKQRCALYNDRCTILGKIAHANTRPAYIVA